jgi:hypothetical protein
MERTLTSNKDDEKMMDIVALYETAVILLIYSLAMIYTYKKVGFNFFGWQEQCTIWMFFLVELANLIVFIWVVVGDFHSIGHILDVTLQ